MIKLQAIVSDLDGTCINDSNEMSPRDVETIRRLMAAGVRFIVCTGRHFVFCEKFVRQFGYAAPVIAANGSIVYDYPTKRVLMSKPLPPETVRRLCDFARAGGSEFSLYSTGGAYFCRADLRVSKMRQYAQTEGCHVRMNYIDSSFDPSGMEVVKLIMPQLEGESIEDMKRRFSVIEGVSVCVSGPQWVDVSREDVDKGSALGWLAEHMGFSLSNTLAFGDNDNDRSMLRAAGISAAPENARADVKSEVDLVTVGNCHSPISCAVERLQAEGRICW